MSGGRGASPIGSGGGRDEDLDRCEFLDIEAWIESVQADAAEDLRVREILFVERVDESGVRTIRLSRSDGSFLGSIADGVPTLLSCLARGFIYVAHVLSIDDGSIKVRIKRP
jgi:hypothetical protein